MKDVIKFTECKTGNIYEYIIFVHNDNVYEVVIDDFKPRYDISFFIDIISRNYDYPTHNTDNLTNFLINYFDDKYKELIEGYWF